MEVANPVKAFLHKNNVDFVQYLLGQVSPTSPKDVWHLCHSGSTQWDSPCHPQTCNFWSCYSFLFTVFEVLFSRKLFFSFLQYCDTLIFITHICSLGLLHLLCCLCFFLLLLMSFIYFLILHRNYIFFWLQQILEPILTCHKAGVPFNNFPNTWLPHLSSESAT